MPDLFDFSADAMSEAELIELGVQDPPRPETRTLDFSVELPHEDAVLICVRHRHDGQWDVVMRDSLGVGHEAIVSALGPTALAASRSCREGMLASIEARIAAAAERKSRAVLSPVGGRGLAPGTTLAGRAARGARRGPSSGGSVAITGAAGYAGSVPRNAALWEVNVGAVRVRLKPGLVWADTLDSDERVFPTVRLAKDNTRGAIDG